MWKWSCGKLWWLEQKGAFSMRFLKCDMSPISHKIHQIPTDGLCPPLLDRIRPTRVGIHPIRKVKDVELIQVHVFKVLWAHCHHHIGLYRQALYIHISQPALWTASIQLWLDGHQVICRERCSGTTFAGAIKLLPSRSTIARTCGGAKTLDGIDITTTHIEECAKAFSIQWNLNLSCSKGKTSWKQLAASFVQKTFADSWTCSSSPRTRWRRFLQCIFHQLLARFKDVKLFLTFHSRTHHCAQIALRGGAGEMNHTPGIHQLKNTSLDSLDVQSFPTKPTQKPPGKKAEKQTVCLLRIFLKTEKLKLWVISAVGFAFHTWGFVKGSRPSLQSSLVPNRTQAPTSSPFTVQRKPSKLRPVEECYVLGFYGGSYKYGCGSKSKHLQTTVLTVLVDVSFTNRVF